MRVSHGFSSKYGGEAKIRKDNKKGADCHEIGEDTVFVGTKEACGIEDNAKTQDAAKNFSKKEPERVFC